MLHIVRFAVSQSISSIVITSPVIAASQESRQKRDQFLDQMSSFLEGIESSTSSSVVDLIPLDPPASNREVRVPSKPPQTQARAAEVDRVSGMEEVLWRTGTEEGATMEATERIFPGPIIGDSFASSPITTVQPTSSLMLEDGQGEMTVFDEKALLVTLLSSGFLLEVGFYMSCDFEGYPRGLLPNRLAMCLSTAILINVGMG